MMVMTNSPAHPESQTSGAVRNCNNNCLGGERGGGVEGVKPDFLLA
jgi:hypothetical protein